MYSYVYGRLFIFLKKTSQVKNLHWLKISTLFYLSSVFHYGFLYLRCPKSSSLGHDLYIWLMEKPRYLEVCSLADHYWYHLQIIQYIYLRTKWCPNFGTSYFMLLLAVGLIYEIINFGKCFLAWFSGSKKLSYNLS